MKSQALLTVWCNISGGAGGEFWHWSLSGVKGLIWLFSELVQKSYCSQVQPPYLVLMFTQLLQWEPNQVKPNHKAPKSWEDPTSTFLRLPTVAQLCSIPLHSSQESYSNSQLGLVKTHASTKTASGKQHLGWGKLTGQDWMPVFD